jgi:hypothetical protein
LGQVTPKPVAGLPTQEVNDKGRYRQHSQSGRACRLSDGVPCDRNFKSIIHRVLKFLLASDVPFRCLHRGVAKEKLNLFQFASTAMAQTGASAAKIVGRQIVYAGLSGAPLHRVPDDIGRHAISL